MRHWLEYTEKWCSKLLTEIHLHYLPQDASLYTKQFCLKLLILTTAMKIYCERHFTQLTHYLFFQHRSKSKIFYLRLSTCFLKNEKQNTWKQQVQQNTSTNLKFFATFRISFIYISFVNNWTSDRQQYPFQVFKLRIIWFEVLLSIIDKYKMRNR